MDTQVRTGKTSPVADQPPHDKQNTHKAINNGSIDDDGEFPDGFTLDDDSKENGLLDRPAAPRSIPRRTGEDRVQAIAALRRLRMSGPEIAEVLSMPRSTVSAILARIGLGKLSALERPEPPNRYERRRPGELLHIDVKKLAGIDPRWPPCHRQPQGPGGWRRMGIRVRLHRRCNPTCLRRGAHR